MAQYDLNLRDYWRVVRKRKYIIIAAVVCTAFFSVLFSMLWQPVPLYKATASIKIEKTSSVTGLYVQAVSWSPTDYMGTQATIIKSYHIVELAAKELGLIPADVSSEEIHRNLKYQKIVLNIRDSIETEQEGYSNILNISVTSADPAFARDLANTIARVHKEHHFIDLNKRTSDAKAFIEGQLQVVKEKLRIAEDTVRKFREEHQLLAVASQTSQLLNQYASLQDTYKKATEAIQTIENTATILNKSGKTALAAKTSYFIPDASPLYKGLNDQLIKLMMERDTLLITYTEEYPRVIEINKAIQEITARMESELQHQHKILKAHIAALQKRIDEIDSKIKTLPERSLALGRLEEDVRINKELYMLLETKYQEILIKEAEKIEEIQIVKPALAPGRPINPPKTASIGFAGILIGLIVGTLLAFVIETFDTSIGDIAEIEEYTGTQVIGLIPHVDVNEIKASIARDGSEEIDTETAQRYSRLISHYAPKSLLAENYRTLRTNLSFSGLGKNIRTLTLTSSSPQEGKTFIVANLAVALAQTGKNVLLIDADMRKPMIAKMFGINQVPGLSDVILGNYFWKDTVNTVSDLMVGKMTVDEIMTTPGLDHLNIITCGTMPPNPAELMSTGTFRTILEEAQKEYDIIILDSPPVLSAADAAILGSISDAIAMVYRVGKVGRGTLKQAVAQLNRATAHIVGVVLNGLNPEISPDFSDYDYYKYYKYYGEDENTPKRKISKIALPAVKVWILLLILLLFGAHALYRFDLIHLPEMVIPLWKDSAAGNLTASSDVDAKPIVRKKIALPVDAVKKGDPDPVIAEEHRGGEQKSNTETECNTEPTREDHKKYGHYTIRIGSFREAGNAKRLARSLQATGIDAWVSVYHSKSSGLWHAVFIGTYGDKDKALSFLHDSKLDRQYPGSHVMQITESAFIDKINAP